MTHFERFAVVITSGTTILVPAVPGSTHTLLRCDVNAGQNATGPYTITGCGQAGEPIAITITTDVPVYVTGTYVSST